MRILEKTRTSRWVIRGCPLPQKAIYKEPGRDLQGSVFNQVWRFVLESQLQSRTNTIKGRTPSAENTSLDRTYTPWASPYKQLEPSLVLATILLRHLLPLYSTCLVLEVLPSLQVVLIGSWWPVLLPSISSLLHEASSATSALC